MDGRTGPAMHRDPSLRKRNALVIPGVLLVLLSLIGILYAQMLRPDTVECEDGTRVVFANACRSAALLLVIPLAIGAGLIGLGARLRSGGTCHLGHGTTATAGLAVLIAAFALPALAALGLFLIQDPDAPYVITYDEIDYGQVRLLGMVAGVMFLVLLPYLILYLCTGRPLRCCRDKACFEPCFCDEETAEAFDNPPAEPEVQSSIAPAVAPAPTPRVTNAVAVATPVPAPRPAPAAPAPVRDNAQVTTTAWSPPPARPAPAAAPAKVAPKPAPAPAAAPKPGAKPAGRKTTRKVTRKKA